VSEADFETIANVNAQVNSEHEYETDQSGYGVGEHWAIMEAGDRGDCEDFALTKMQELIDAGYDAKNLQMAWGQTETGGDHAFLIIQTSNRGTLVLDNRYQSVMRIENVPYRFQAYQRAGTAWAGYTTLLTAVSVEYMNCNAAAFMDGDEVIVEFTNQDFSQPKVIGFKDNPNDCFFDYYAFMGMSFLDFVPGVGYVPESNNAKYNSVTDTWWGLSFLPTVGDWPSSAATWSRTWPGFAANSSYNWIFGGIKYPGSVGGLLDRPYPYLNTWDTNMVLSERFDKVGNSWAVRATLPTPKRNNLAGFMLLGKIHLVGGTEYQYHNVDPVSEVYNDHDQYDDTLDSYISRSEKTVCRAAYWTLDNKAYIFGGNIINMGFEENNDPDNWTGGLAEYDPVGNSWAAKTASAKRYNPTGFSLPGKGYAFGGMEVSSWLGDLDEWDKLTDVWSAKSNQPNGGYSYGQRPAIGFGGYAYIWSYEPGQSPRNDHFKWEQIANAWSQAGEHPPWLGFEGAGSAL